MRVHERSATARSRAARKTSPRAAAWRMLTRVNGAAGEADSPEPARAWPGIQPKGDTVLAYSFLEVMWTMFVFFAWVLVVWLDVMLMIDNFKRTDHSGWAKGGWTLLIFLVPV